MSPSEMILRYFKYDHLPENLAAVSRPFCELATLMANRSAGPETTAGLRKLLESKDCFVRAALHEKFNEESTDAVRGRPPSSSVGA